MYKPIFCYKNATTSEIKLIAAIAKGFLTAGDNPLALNTLIIDEPDLQRRVLNANGPAFSPPFTHTRKR